MVERSVSIGSGRNVLLFDDETQYLDENGNPTGITQRALHTDALITTTAKPQGANDVLRKGDVEDGSQTMVIIGNGTSPRFRLRWDETEYKAIAEIWNGTAWEKAGHYGL